MGYLKLRNSCLIWFCILAVILNAQSLLLVTSLQDLARVRDKKRGRMERQQDVSMCGGHGVEGKNWRVSTL